MYCGPAFAFKEHMYNLKYEPLNPGANIADFGMDVLAGFIPRVGQVDVDNVIDTIEILCSWWAENKIEEHEAFLANQKQTIEQRMVRMKALVNANVHKNKKKDASTGRINSSDGRKIQNSSKKLNELKKSFCTTVHDNIMSNQTCKTLYISMIRQINVSLYILMLFLIFYK